jgi:hypothetical protein
MSPATDHASLVEVARKWLANHGCSLIATEIATQGEEPDAIGWQATYSTLIECKATRADFLGDGKKCFRREPDRGMGLARYFLTPVGLIQPEELPRGWGLLEFTGKQVRVKVKSLPHEADARQELRILLSVIKRIGATAPKGVSIRCFTHQTRCRSTMSVGDELDV